MSLESFYGGKQGLSSVIKKAFRYISVQDPAYLVLSEEEKALALQRKEVMEECLSDNSYEEVWYGELCIINTYNKNNPANGCLFRRTLARKGSRYPAEIYKGRKLLDDNLDALSAEYIGQIVGPKSGTPFVQVTSLEDVDDHAAAPLELYDETAWETDQDHVYNNIQYYTGEIVYDAPMETEDTYRHDALENAMFFSGRKYAEEDWEEQILYNWFNIRKGSDDESWMYLGVKAPYFVADFAFKEVDYFKPVSQTDTYPDRDFYQDWHITVPRGVRGNAASDIFITSLDKFDLDEAGIYQSFSSIIHITDDNDIGQVRFENGGAKVDTDFISAEIGDEDREPHETEEDLIAYLKTVPFYCCEYTIYNSDDEDIYGHTAYFYIGLVKHVDNFTMTDQGVVTAHFTNDTFEVINEKTPIIWIKDITVNATNAEENPGLLTVVYNNSGPYGKQNYTKQLVLPKSIDYDDNAGDFTITNTDGSNYVIGTITHPTYIYYVDDIGQFRIESNNIPDYFTDEDHPIEYVKDIDYDDEHGLFIFTTNIKKDGVNKTYIVNEDQIVDYVKNIVFNKQQGQFIATTNTGRTIIMNAEAFILLENIEFSENGLFTITKTDGTQIILNEDYPVEWVTEIELAGNATAENALDDRRIRYKTNINDEFTSIGDEINYVQEFVKHSDGHLYVLFNAPSYRYTTTGYDSVSPVSDYRLEDGKYYKREIEDENGVIWRNDIDESISAKLYWRDYGLSVGYHKGLYVGTVLNFQENKTTTIVDGEEIDSYTYNYIADDGTVTSTLITKPEDILGSILNTDTYGFKDGLSIVDMGVDGTLDRRGMLVVARLHNKEFTNYYDSTYFAYDYDGGEWYIVQTIQGIYSANNNLSILVNDVEINTDDAYINVGWSTQTSSVNLNAPWNAEVGKYAISST